jgi:hypothetical protein
MSKIDYDKIKPDLFSKEEEENLLKCNFKMIKDLEKSKDKSIKRLDTDDFWIGSKVFNGVLFVIFAIGNGNMVII